MQRAPKILFYNNMFDVPADISALIPSERRAFVWDVAQLPTCDAVVFHVPSLKIKQGLAKQSGQIWVLWSMESVVNYPCLKDPAFLKWFDLSMTYERTADVWTPYIPDTQCWSALAQPIQEKTEPNPAVMFQSAKADRSDRVSYAAELMTHMNVDSYGKILNNKALPVPDLRRSTKLEVISRYKFCLAFENSIALDYVTEKLFDALLVGSVPIYLGAPNVQEFSPGDDAYIDVRNFASPRHLADYLHFLDRNEDEYQRFLAWRSRPLRQSFIDAQEKQPPFSQLYHLIADRLRK